MEWPASGQLPGRDPNGGYARRRFGGSVSDGGSIPPASTILQETRDPASRTASPVFPDTGARLRDCGLLRQRDAECLHHAANYNLERMHGQPNRFVIGVAFW